MVAGLRDNSRMLTDGVITLREPCEEDVDAIVEACQDPEIPRWTRVPSPYGRADAHTFLELSAAGRADGSGYSFLGFDADGNLLGAFGLMEVAGDQGEIGYWVVTRFTGRGVATTTVSLLAVEAFSDPSTTHIEIHHATANLASAAVAHRSGFTTISTDATETIWRLTRTDWEARG